MESVQVTVVFGVKNAVFTNNGSKKNAVKGGAYSSAKTDRPVWL